MAMEVVQKCCPQQMRMITARMKGDKEIGKKTANDEEEI